MRKIIIFITLLLIPLSLSFSATRPDWVDSWEKKYSGTIYLGAVGSGKTEDAAVTDAYNSLAAYFGVSVDSKTTTYTGSRTWNGYGKSASTEVTNFQSEAVVSINIENIAGVTIKEKWSGDGEYYALALLDRASAALYYINQAEDAASTISYYQTIDPSSLSFRAIGSVQGLKDVALSYYEAVKILSVLAPDKVRTLPQLPSDSEILSLIDSFTYELGVSVAGSSDDWYMISGNVYDALSEAGITPSRSEARYELIDELSLSETTLPGNPLKFVKYSLTLKIIDNESGKYVFSWTASGREGQMTYSAAKERAFTALNKKIKNELSSTLDKTFKL